MNELKILKLNENAVIPSRATEGSAGMDLYACTNECITVNPGELVSIPTGIAVSLPSKEFGLFIFARSGLGIKHGISLSNGVGVVDSDYRGEIQVGLCNLGNKPYTIKPKERIAQMIVLPVAVLPVIQTEALDATQRGSGGFGSTGRT